MPIPILFLGDSPSMTTGLARIGRDLAMSVSRMPQYRVGYLGRGGGAHVNSGIADSRLPFMQYTFQPTMHDQWGAGVLPQVWRNFAGDERGVIFTIWDPSRLTWFGNPLPSHGYEELYEFLMNQPNFERWGYFAIDSPGPLPGGALVPMLADTMRGFNRILAYTAFGSVVMSSSMPERAADIEWLPHGYIGKSFQPRDKREARARFERVMGTLDDQPLIGCVMTNQERKDFGVWAQAARGILDTESGARFWLHTDSLDRHWDIHMLLDAYQLYANTVVTVDSPSDVELSWRYSACDLTMLPSLGEGFGYPIVESQACGVPCVHGNVGGGAELVPARWRVQPTDSRLDTRYCLVRPVFDPAAWAEAVMRGLDFIGGAGSPAPFCEENVAHLEWRHLWPSTWEKWFLRGAERFADVEVRA